MEGQPRDRAFDAAAVLRAARRRGQLTQSELARRSGTSQAAISDIERGRRQPTVDLLDRLLRACGTRITVLGEPVMEVDPHDLTLLRLNTQLSPAERLARVSSVLRLKGLARR